MINLKLNGATLQVETEIGTYMGHPVMRDDTIPTGEFRLGNNMSRITAYRTGLNELIRDWGVRFFHTFGAEVSRGFMVIYCSADTAKELVQPYG